MGNTRKVRNSLFLFKYSGSYLNMLYFSEFFGDKVFTQNKQFVGKVADLMFLPLETPLITKFLIKTDNQSQILVAAQDIKKNGKGFILKQDFITFEKKEDELSLLFTLQNQQVIDLNGEKIIRVNDVIVSDAPEFIISGIDVGILGVFRWIGLARWIASLLRRFSIQYKSSFIPWDEIQTKQLASRRIVLKKDQERLKKIHPEDLAEHLGHATIQNVLKSLKIMDTELSARVIADLKLDYQKEILLTFSPQRSGQILSLIDPDEAVDALLVLEKNKREAILPFIEKSQRGEVEYLLKHAKSPIGHMMTTEWCAVDSDLTVKTVIEKIRKETTDFSELSDIYATNSQKQLVGVLDLHSLLLQRPEIPFYKVMNQNLIVGRLTTPKEILLRRMLKYNLNAMPIVDENRTIIGVVLLHDIAEDLLQKE